jgi:hypothetical protein
VKDHGGGRYDRPNHTNPEMIVKETIDQIEYVCVFGGDGLNLRRQARRKCGETDIPSHDLSEISCHGSIVQFQ